MAKFPLGARGEFPCYFPCRLGWERMRELTNVPGIVRAPGGLKCTWDLAEPLAKWLDQPVPTPPLEENVDLEVEIKVLPGLARYRELGLDKKLRLYQKEDAVYLARRAFALNCNGMRMGKSVEALAGATLIGAKRVLIVCPAIAKWVWADEIAKWLREEALILEGRGGDLARRYCLACMSRGRIGTERCPSCKMRNGQSNGFRRFEAGAMRSQPEKMDLTGVIYRHFCRRHKHQVLDIREARQQCPHCTREIDDEIEKSRFVIVNFDLLVGQSSSDAAGRVYYREDLQGWAPALAKYNFDLCVGDESHNLRGFTTDQRKKGTTRREKFNLVTENIERVWLLTGTPIFGYVRDLWGQMDAMSKGALTGGADRLPFKFHTAYCDGHKGEYGWVADGRSLRADTELKDRLRFFMIQRKRAEVLTELPPKTRQTIRIDDTRPSRKLRIPKGEDDTGRITRLLKNTFDAKVDTVIENVMNELAEGSKVVVFTLLRESAARLAKAIERECLKREYATRMRAVDTKVWLAHGDTQTQARFEMARNFREHTGAGAFVTTIDAVQVAVSLKGATSVHFAELHWQPAAMLQAEDRPYEVGTTKLNVVYYIVRQSIDEHLESVLAPKIETKDRLENGSGAKEMRDAFNGPDEDAGKSLRQILEGLTAHLKLSENPYLGDDDD